MTEPDLLTLSADRSATPVILFGFDDKDKRHASYFDADLGAQAIDAAAKMGMAALHVTAGELADLGQQLPKGKIFESGKAFVPFVKQPLFERLAGYLPDQSVLASLRAAARDAEAGKKTDRTFTYPKDRAAFAVGNLVLADEDVGWFEAVVEEITGVTLTLSWRDWQDEPRFERERDQVALLPVPRGNAN